MMPLNPGGTANLAVLGGNLPPSSGGAAMSPKDETNHPALAGLVARPHGPVARATQTGYGIVPSQFPFAGLVGSTTRYWLPPLPPRALQTRSSVL